MGAFGHQVPSTLCPVHGMVVTLRMESSKKYSRGLLPWRFCHFSRAETDLFISASLTSGGAPVLTQERFKWWMNGPVTGFPPTSPTGRHRGTQTNVPLGILCAHPSFMSESLADEIQDKLEGEPSQCCHWDCDQGKTPRAKASHLECSPNPHWLFQCLAIPCSLRVTMEGIVLLLQPCAEAELWGFLPVSLRVPLRAAGSPFPASLLCSCSQHCLLTWHFIWISRCFRIACLRAGRSTGNKKWNEQFCQAFAVAQQRADNRNVCVWFDRMNDQVVCNQRKSSDLIEMIIYSTKH